MEGWPSGSQWEVILREKTTTTTKNRTIGITLPDFRLYNKAYSNQKSMVLEKQNKTKTDT